LSGHYPANPSACKLQPWRSRQHVPSWCWYHARAAVLHCVTLTQQCDVSKSWYLPTGLYTVELSTPQYFHVLPGNATNNLWVLDLIPWFFGYSPGEITVNYNTFRNA
jgi:hypothetical protein